MLYLLSDKRIAGFFQAYGCARTVSGIDDGIVVQNEKLSLDGVDDIGVAAAGEVGATDALLEEGVAADEELLHQQADTTGCVSRGMNDLQLAGSEVQLHAVLQDQVCSHRLHGAIHIEAEVLTVVQQHGSIETMDGEWASKMVFEPFVAADMIAMTVGIDDVFYLETQVFDPLEQGL